MKKRSVFWIGVSYGIQIVQFRSTLPFLFYHNMDVENSVLENEPSKTPELDADMPKKGIPRLVIEKLVLENFKSYAGVKVH